MVDVLTAHGDVLFAYATVTGHFHDLVRVDFPNGERDKLVSAKYLRVVEAPDDWEGPEAPGYSEVDMEAFDEIVRDDMRGAW